MWLKFWIVVGIVVWVLSASLAWCCGLVAMEHARHVFTLYLQYTLQFVRRGTIIIDGGVANEETERNPTLARKVGKKS